MRGCDSFECERKDSDHPADGEGIENAGQGREPWYPCKNGFQKRLLFRIRKLINWPYIRKEK